MSRLAVFLLCVLAATGCTTTAERPAWEWVETEGDDYVFGYAEARDTTHQVVREAPRKPVLRTEEGDDYLYRRDPTDPDSIPPHPDFSATRTAEEGDDYIHGLDRPRSPAASR